MSGLEHLEKRIRATATEGFVIGALVGLMGLGLAALAGAAPGEMELSQRLFIAAMAAGGCIAGWMIISGARANLPPTETRVYKALAGDAKEVAWAFQKVGKANGVEIYFTDGDMTSLTARGDDAQALLRFIHERAPHALLGYGDAQKAAFASLRAERRNAT